MQESFEQKYLSRIYFTLIQGFCTMLLVLKRIIIFAIATSFGVVICQQPQCTDIDSSVDCTISSDADFWKGIDGAQFITELNNDSDRPFIRDNARAFVMYYHPGCPYAREAQNGFAGSAKRLNNKLGFGAVDCDKAEKETSDQLNHACRRERPVRGYPTFYFFKDGRWNEEYNGERTIRAFVNYLNRK